MMKADLLIIDPQNDFCNQKGSLFVKGADEDSVRLAEFINRAGDKLNDIHVTLDSHHSFDVAHPIAWVGKDGKHPSPFTIITSQDVNSGVWRATNPSDQKWFEHYVNELELDTPDHPKRYALCIWPYHCLIGHWGHNVVDSVIKALDGWEESQIAVVDYVTKGSNYKTEHYSAVRADVFDPDDPGTLLNTQLITLLDNCDRVYIAGQASSHCVANTVKDIAFNFNPDSIKKLVFLEDCSSPVPGFEQLEIDFLTEMKGRGMKISQSVKELL